VRKSRQGEGSAQPVGGEVRLLFQQTPESVTITVMFPATCSPVLGTLRPLLIASLPARFPQGLFAQPLHCIAGKLRQREGKSLGEGCRVWMLP
jgi:hypothetical protein